jgi:protein-disulfide isomerase
MSDKVIIPISIIIAGALIGGGLYLGGKKRATPATLAAQAVEQSKNIRPVDDTDHILGNPSAKLLFVEYSDTECPFCKEFHRTLKTLMSEYGDKGDLAWVYRHYPILDLHPKAAKEAQATECANELGGNGKFWEYINRLYEVTPSDNKLDPVELVNIAKQVGLSSDQFTSCLESNKYSSLISAHIEDAKKTGSQGTPYSIIIDTQTGETYPIVGAQPYATLKQLIELILQSS